MHKHFLSCSLLQPRALFWSQITALGWAQACTAPTLCCFLSLVRGSGSSLAHARKQPSIEAAIRHCGCQKDSAVFSKQRINTPELMIINGQRARISDWAWCSGRELGLVEDVATALSFSTTLPPAPPHQDAGPWVCFWSWRAGQETDKATWARAEKVPQS